MTSAPPARVPRRYVDLRLELRGFDPDRETYTVALTGPTAGEPPPVEVDLRSDDLAAGLRDLEDGGIEDPEDLLDLGRALADRLLPDGPIRTAVVQAITSAGPDDGVRLRLVTHEPRLAQIPWEYTYLSALDRSADADFLVLDPRVSLVRHEALPLPHSSVAARDPGRLRLIVATANAPGFERLNLRLERRVLRSALDKLAGDAVAEQPTPTLMDPTVAELQEALAGGADVFHFAGHGGFDDDGYLALPAPDGVTAERLPADRLALSLRQAGVRVAVFGACETGRRGGASPWPGLASALVAAQIPAVVAMQYRIVDTNAIAFSRAFYTALATGLSIDEAVTTGRLAGYRSETDSMEAPWGIPVLYSRSPDGLLLGAADGRTSPTGDALRARLSITVDHIRRTGKVVGIDVARVAAGELDIEVRVGTVDGELSPVRELYLG